MSLTRDSSFKELEFPLKTIKEILDNPSYSRYKALEDHICLLELRQKQLTQLIQHVKKLQEGESEMTFKAYDKSELEAYQKEAKERWGEGSYFKEYEILAEQLDEKQITIDMNQIFKNLVLFNILVHQIYLFKNRLVPYKTILVIISIIVIMIYYQI